MDFIILTPVRLCYKRLKKMVACYTASGMTDRNRQTDRQRAKTGRDKSCRNGQMKD